MSRKGQTNIVTTEGHLVEHSAKHNATQTLQSGPCQSTIYQGFSQKPRPKLRKLVTYLPPQSQSL